MPDNSDKAREFEKRARLLVAVFQSWAHTPPAPEARAASIHQLLDLQREVLDYFSARGKE